MRISDIRNTQLFQDLCQTLFAAEYPAPELFSRGAERFKDLRPEYIWALMSGLSYALTQGHSINWEPVLELCMFVADEPLPLPAEDDRRPELFVYSHSLAVLQE